MGILSGMLSLFNPAQGDSIVSTAAGAAPIVLSGGYLTDNQIACVRDTAAALASQQAQYGYVDIDPALAELIADAADAVDATGVGHWDRLSGEWVR